MTREMVREDNKRGVIDSLRKQPYTPAQFLAELIDNSNSARQLGQKTVNVSINIQKDPNTNQTILTITDDGRGIAADDFGKVIGYANSIGGGVQNEHGMGLKQASLAMGSYLRKLESRDLNSKNSTYAEFKDMYAVLDPFEIKEALFPHPGTKIELVLREDNPLLTEEGFLDCISELQVVYQKVLGRSLNIEIDNAFMTDANYKGKLVLQPDSTSNHLHNPIHQDSSWIVTKELKGSKGNPWTAIIKIGFLADNGTPNLIQKLNGVIKQTNISKHQRTLDNQGIAIFKGDRLVSKTKGWTLNGFNSVFDARRKTFQHNDYNGLIIEAEVDGNFSTVPTKNGINTSSEYQEFQLELNTYLRRIIPDPKPGAKNKVGMKSAPLLEFVHQWNKGNTLKVEDTPTTAIPWHHKQTTLQQGWSPLKHFGMWKIWEHKGTNKVVAIHKNGVSAQIAPSDRPDMGAFSEHIKIETDGRTALPVFVHNFPDMLPVSHYSWDMKPTVCTPKDAVKEISKSVLVTPRVQQIMQMMVASSMLQKSLKDTPEKFKKDKLAELEAQIMAP